MTLVQTEPKSMKIRKPSRLPAEYQEVEYIQSSGTQLIVIGNSFSTDYKVEIDVQLTATGSDQILFGCITNSYKFGINAYSSNFKTTTGGNSWNDTKSEDSNRHTFIMDKSTTYVDGTSYSSSYVSYTFNFGLGLFSYNREESSWRFPAQMKLFSCKIYDGSIILYDLVPCYRKADDVIGLYDLVNDTFYTNSGSGTFTKGNDVNLVEKEIKRVTIRPNGAEKQIRPVGWQPGANTLAYYPLETDTKDYSGNGRDGTNNGVTFSNGLGVFNGSSYVSLGTGGWTNIQTNMTINVWFKWNGNGSKDNSIITKSRYYMQDYNRGIYSITIHAEDKYLCGGYYNGSDYNIHPMNFRNTSGGSPTIGPVAQANKWYNVVITNDGNTKKAYVNGVLYATENISSTTSTVSIDTRIGSIVRYNYDGYFNGNISAVIFEDKTWTPKEISDYYNQTKGNYGIQTLNNSLNNTFTPTITPDIPDTPGSGTGDILTI